MTHTTQIKELLALREKATEGEWHTVGLPWNTASPYIIAGHHDPHVGKAIIDVMDQDFYEGEDDDDIAAQQQQNEAEQHGNCEFIAAAANARPALKALLEENETLKERMAQDDSVAASAIEFYQKQVEALEKQLSERDALLAGLREDAYHALKDIEQNGAEYDEIYILRRIIRDVEKIQQERDSK